MWALAPPGSLSCCRIVFIKGNRLTPIIFLFCSVWMTLLTCLKLIGQQLQYADVEVVTNMMYNDIRSFTFAANQQCIYVNCVLFASMCLMWCVYSYFIGSSETVPWCDAVQCWFSWRREPAILPPTGGGGGGDLWQHGRHQRAPSPLQTRRPRLHSPWLQQGEDKEQCNCEELLLG